MGGDAAPQMVVRGAEIARQRFPLVDFLMFGREEEIEGLLDSLKHLREVTTVVHTEEVVSSDDKPSAALRTGRNSSMRLAINPIYVRHEVVHNRFVVDDLKQKGAIFVDELDQIPDDSYVIFSAHGVSRAVRREAERRQLRVFDATCPLVTKVHMEVSRYSRKGIETF